MRAGWKFSRRNPTVHPASATASPATRNWPLVPATAKTVILLMAASPAARPSMLSSRLNAFVMPTNQSTVRIRSTVSTVVTAVPLPKDQTIDAAETSAINRHNGDTCRKSSISPTAARSTAIVRTPNNSPRPVWGGRSTDIRITAITNVTTIARPPRYGTATLWLLC